MFRVFRWTGSLARVGRPPAARSYAPLLALVALLLGFLSFAAASRDPGPESLDRRVLLMLREAPDDPLGPPWFEELWINWTALGSGAVVSLIVMAIAGYLLLEHQWRSAIWIVLSTLGATVLSTLLKLSYDRPRPDVVEHFVEVTSKSFPSGHSLLAAAVYPTLGAVLAQVSPHRRVRIYFMTLSLGLAALIGLSRVYLGVHYPTDVLGGSCLGLGWALLCYLATRSLQRRGTIESPEQRASAAPDRDRASATSASARPTVR